MNKKFKIIGYSFNNYLPAIRTEDVLKLTHLNVAFGHIRDNEIRIDHLKNLDHLKVLKTINPNLTILLSVGGWGTGRFSEAASTLENRKLMAESVVKILKE